MILQHVQLSAGSWRPSDDAGYLPPAGDLHLVTVHKIERGSERGWVRVHGWVPYPDRELPRRNVLLEVRRNALPAEVLPKEAGQ